MSDIDIGSLLRGAAELIFALIAAYNLAVSRARARTVAELEKNTNSIKDALIKVTGEAEHAKGVLQGRTESETMPR